MLLWYHYHSMTITAERFPRQDTIHELEPIALLGTALLPFHFRTCYQPTYR